MNFGKYFAQITDARPDFVTGDDFTFIMDWIEGKVDAGHTVSVQKVSKVQPEDMQPTVGDPLKMYILVLDNVDLGHAILAVGHGVAAAVQKFGDEPVTRKWQKESFRKVVCKVTPEQFEKAKTYDLDYVAMTESALANAPTALVFKPGNQWPTFFKSLALYR